MAAKTGKAGIGTALKVGLTIVGIGVAAGTALVVGMDQVMKKVFVKEEWPKQEWADDEWAEEDLEN